MSEPGLPKPGRIIEVAAALVFREGKLLITRRHAQAHQGGLWEFPGGKREPLETFEQCLARELREELGIKIAVGQLLERMLHQYPERTVQLQFYRCRWVRGEPQPLGCADVKWVTRARITRYPFPAADARLLERLVRNASLWAEETV